jgi:hypothetical protein
MVNLDDREKTFEELKEICGGFFSDEVLRTFYDCEMGKSRPHYNRCPSCSIEKSPENKELFYTDKSTRCKVCSVRKCKLLNRSYYIQRKERGYYQSKS